MYKKLKKKLILMYWLTSTMILTGVIVTILISGVRQNRRDELLSFERSSIAYMEQIQQLSTVNHSWIKKLEQENHWYLMAMQNEVDLMLPNIYPYEGDLTELFQRLKDLTEETQPDLFTVFYHDGQKTSEIIKICTDGSSEYYGRLFMIRNSQSTELLMVVKKMETVTSRCMKNARILLICELIGSMLLFLLSFGYVNKVVRPVEEANVKQREFIAAVSHELRSPLAVLRVGVSSMQADLEQYEPDSRLKKYLYPMEGECVRMNRLIEDMLLLAATDQKTWTISQTEVDLETLLIECYDAFCMMNQKVQDKIQIDLSQEDLPYIMGDAERMKQVIMILLDNAMSYTNMEDGIVLRAYRQQNEVFIEVEDHGDGINDEEKKKIFERFYRREGARSDRKHFGLGLSIAQRLVELHHGRIEVKDTNGHGTTFVVCLSVEGGKHES